MLVTDLHSTFALSPTSKGNSTALHLPLNEKVDALSSQMDASAAVAANNSVLDKPRLTDQEKKNNHIASEQKRRQAIREGFDDIADIVPGLKGQGRSESLVLEGATAHIKKLLAERHQLVHQAQESGIDCGNWELDEISMSYARQAAEEEETLKKSKR